MKSNAIKVFKDKKRVGKWRSNWYMVNEVFFNTYNGLVNVHLFVTAQRRKHQTSCGTSVQLSLN